MAVLSEQVLVGGSALDHLRGFFVQPTVVAFPGVAAGPGATVPPITHEERFIPVLYVIKVCVRMCGSSLCCIIKCVCACACVCASVCVCVSVSMSAYVCMNVCMRVREYEGVCGCEGWFYPSAV